MSQFLPVPFRPYAVPKQVGLIAHSWHHDSPWPTFLPRKTKQQGRETEQGQNNEKRNTNGGHSAASSHFASCCSLQLKDRIAPWQLLPHFKSTASRPFRPFCVLLHLRILTNCTHVGRQHSLSLRGDFSGFVTPQHWAQLSNEKPLLLSIILAV